MNKIDIVVPIYNAYEFTKKCIETVIENTNLLDNNLILINDKSPDIRISELLKKIKEKNINLNIVIIENEINEGFVKNVNKGMKYSKNDVILLNSDTEVTPRWTEKMVEVAYMKENIATVTPLSNNATIASVPNFLEENDVPNYISVNEYANIIEKCSFNDFPEISTAHGFCMYIKREAIEKVGLFDDVTFEKGYGEENDFSYRCTEFGFINILCDNTFIYHKGTQSFTEKKQKLIDSHLEILKNKFPQNFEQTNKIVNTNPFKYIQDNIKFSVGNNYRKNVLIVTHEFERKECKLIGGTARHIYDLVENLRKYMNIHVFYPANENEYKITSFFEDYNTDIELGKINSYENIKFYNKEYEKLLEKVFSIINVDIIHIHHLKNHYFDIGDVIMKKKIPYIVTLHDFYMVCPTIVLLENGEKYCGDNEYCDCKSCINSVIGIKQNIISSWRENFYKILSNANKLIAPSYSTKDIFNKYYENLNIDVIEHGVDIPQSLNTNKEKNAKKNIAFLGGINKNKGVDILKKFINLANSNKLEYNVHMFGETSNVELNHSSNNYIFHGIYDKDDIVRLLNENSIDLICLFSIWPETYSYTLTEALIAEIPVIAFDYGAVSERISKNNLGWVLNKNCGIGDIIKKISEIFLSREEYREKVENIRKYKLNLKSVSQNAQEYKDIYESYFPTITYYKNIDKNYFKEILKNSDNINNQKNSDIQLKYNYLLNKYNEENEKNNNRIVEYDKTVKSLRNEINRLNQVIEDTKDDEKKYKKLLDSRRIKFLKKIKFIKY